MTKYRGSWIVMLVVAAVTAIGSPRPAHAGFFGDIIDSVTDAVGSVQDVFDSVSGLGDILSNAINTGGNVAGAAAETAGSAATSYMMFAGVGGNNTIGGYYKQDTEVTFTGKLTVKPNAVFTAGHSWIAASTINGFVDLKQRVTGGSVTIGEGAEVHLASFIAMQANIESVKFDTDVRFDNLTVGPNARFEAGSLRITNTRVGPVDVRSRVQLSTVDVGENTVTLIGGTSM